MPTSTFGRKLDHCAIAVGYGSVLLCSQQHAVHNAIVRNIGHFDNEIDVAGSEGLEGMKVHNIKPQRAFKNEAHLLPKEVDEKVAKLRVLALRAKRTVFAQEQAVSKGVKEQGPFNGGHYRS